jgi:hypothetical protein
VTTPPDAPDPSHDAARFRATMVRVMGVQLVTLVLLWLVQSRYSV